MNIPCLVSECERCTAKIRLLSPSWFGRDYKTAFNVVPPHVKSLLNVLMPLLGIFPLFLHAHVVFLPWCRWLEVTSDIFLSSRWIGASIELIASVKIRDVCFNVSSRKMLRLSFRWTKNGLFIGRRPTISFNRQCCTLTHPFVCNDPNRNEQSHLLCTITAWRLTLIYSRGW